QHDAYYGGYLQAADKSRVDIRGPPAAGLALAAGDGVAPFRPAASWAMTAYSPLAACGGGAVTKSPPGVGRRGAAGASWVARRRSRMSRRASMPPLVFRAISTRVSAPPARNDVNKNTPTVWRIAVSAS